MRFYSFGTDFKYALDCICSQEIYADADNRGIRLAFVLESTPAGSTPISIPHYRVEADDRPHITMPQPTVDYEVVIEACHVWMVHQGIPDQPIWFLALPPGKSPEEFFSIERLDTEKGA